MKLKTLVFIPLMILIFTVADMKLTRHDVMNTAPPRDTTAMDDTSGKTPDAIPDSTHGAEPGKTFTEPEKINIIAVGDIMLGRRVGSGLEKQKDGYIYAFEEVADTLRKGDVIFGNLEDPITESTTSLDKNGKIILKAKPAALSAIQYAGFNLLSLANNHMLDYYARGLLDTMDLLDSAGIRHSGAGRNIDDARKLCVIEKKGIKTGLLSYTDMAETVFNGNPRISFAAGEDKAGVAPRVFEYIREDIGYAQKDADILIISLHWGIEESFEVTDDQRKFAHDLIDLGADMVLGHHPHQFQGMEIYNGKLIAYSLGNFIFDQNDPENQESFILDMDFTKEGLTALSAIPVRTIGKIRVVPQTGTNASGLLDREAVLSEKLGSKCHIEDNKLVFDLK